MARFRCNLRGQVVVVTMMGFAAAATVAPLAVAGDGRIGHDVYKSKTVEQVNLLAVNSSANGRFAIVIYGGGDELAKFAYQIAEYYERATPHDVSIIEADDNDGNGLNAEMHIYYNGERRYIYHVRPATDGQTLGDKIISDFNRIIESR